MAGKKKHTVNLPESADTNGDGHISDEELE